MHSISTPTTNELGMKLDTGMHYLGGIYRVTVHEQRAWIGSLGIGTPIDLLAFTYSDSFVCRQVMTIQPDKLLSFPTSNVRKLTSLRASKY